MCWQKIPCEYFLSHIFHAKKAREERALRENWLRFLLLLLLLLLFLLLVVAVVAGGPLDPDYVPAQYPPGIRTEGFISGIVAPLGGGHTRRKIGENWKFYEYWLIGWRKNHISVKCQRYMTFTPPLQQIFIEFTIFSDFSNSALKKILLPVAARPPWDIYIFSSNYWAYWFFT